jgi:hypothetical protein
MPDGEPAERPRPLDRIPGRHHPQLEAPVIRLRLREGLDSAEYLADVRGQHARYLAREEGLAVYLHGRPRPAGRQVPDPGDDIGGATQPVLRAPVGVGDHPRIEARARHHHEALAVHRPRVQPSSVPVQPDLDRLGEIVRYLEVRRQQVRGSGGQDCHRRVGPRHRVDAALDGAIATPDEQHVRPLGDGPAGVLGCAAALLHLVPQRVGDAFPSQDLPQLRQAAAQALARVRHYSDVSHLVRPFASGPRTARTHRTPGGRARPAASGTRRTAGSAGSAAPCRCRRSRTPCA